MDTAFTSDSVAQGWAISREHADAKGLQSLGLCLPLPSKKNKLPHQRSLEWNILAVLLQKRKKQTKPQWPLWGVVLFWFVSSAVWAASWAALLLETNFACLRQQAVRGMGKCRGQTIPMPPRVATLHYSSESWYWDRKSHPIVPETFLSIPALNFSISILSHLRYNLNFKLSCPK